PARPGRRGRLGHGAARRGAHRDHIAGPRAGPHHRSGRARGHPGGAGAGGLRSPAGTGHRVRRHHHRPEALMFTGFPEAALDFYDDLEMDNSRTFFQAHRHIYDTAVLAPMRALTDLLADEFGPAKIYRPHRDLRFSKDKSPYKTHQGAVVPTAPSAGYYVEVSAAGVRVAGGFYHAEPDRLAALRTAIDHELYGPELERIVAALTADGFVLGGDRLKTAPRG